MSSNLFKDSVITDLPGHLVRRLHQRSTALFVEECGSYDLTPVQYGALATIDQHPGLDATRLSGLIAFDRSTIGDVLERIETKGWIERTASAGDRRMKLLYSTSAGRKLLRNVAPAVDRVQRRMLAVLAPDERETFLRLLDTLTSVEAAAGPAQSAAE